MMQYAPRRLRRHPLIFYLKVYDLDRQQPLGFLSDITLEGMMVVSEQPVEAGQEFELEVRNQSGLDSAQTVRCRARSLWCQGDVDPECFAVGFQFDQLPRESESAIRALIREIGFEE